MIDDWQESRLGDVADIYSGYAFKSKEMSSSPEEGVPLVKIKNIFDRKVSEVYDSYLMSDYVLEKYDKYRLIDGDILVAMTGQGSVGRIGKMHRVKKEILVNQRVGIVRVNPNLANKEFVYQQIATTHNESVYFNLAMGAGQPNLSPKDISNLKIQLPPLPTQRKIAAILSAYDDLIENNLKRIKLLEEKAQLTYEEWFVRMKFPGHESTPINEETGLPVGWENEYFETCLKFKTGKLDSNALVEGGKYDFYTCSKEVLKTNTFCYEGEAVLLGGNNATGDFALFYANDSFDVYQRTYIVTSIKGHIPLVYVYFYFQKLLPYFKIVSSGASTKFLTMKILNKTKIKVPPKWILIEYESLIKPCFDLTLELQRQNQLLKEARDILLPRLMTGMIDLEKLDLSAFELGDTEGMMMAAEQKERYSNK